MQALNPQPILPLPFLGAVDKLTTVAALMAKEAGIIVLDLLMIGR